MSFIHKIFGIKRRRSQRSPLADWDSPSILNITERQVYLSNSEQKIKEEQEVFKALNTHTVEILRLATAINHSQSLDQIKALDQYIKDMLFNKKLENKVNE